MVYLKETLRIHSEEGVGWGFSDSTVLDKQRHASELEKQILKKHAEITGDTDQIINPKISHSAIAFYKQRQLVFEKDSSAKENFVESMQKTGVNWAYCLMRYSTQS